MQNYNKLPYPLTRFIGREQLLTEIERLLHSTRLLTLTGPGGAGKTRLALHSATHLQLAGNFRDGACLVKLAQLTGPALLLQTVCQALGLSELPGQGLLEIITASLDSKELLLVLDNCEHVIEECARVAEALLGECPSLRILATSREGLGIPAETILQVPPLALPARSNQPHLLNLSNPVSFQIACQSEAIRFFCDRAQAAQPAFEITEANVQAITLICYTLDGIPLALELAAARLKVLSLEQIAARLQNSFELLTGGSRTALPRQQTLQALMDWSHSLLTQREQVLLRRLAVFRGGWSLEAAEAICVGVYSLANGQGKIEQREILDLLAQLVNKSLVQLEEVPTGAAARYNLLETVRQYAWLKLEESGEVEGWLKAHSNYFLALAEQAEPLLSGPQQVQLFNRLEMEHPNFRVALAWLLEKGQTNPEKYLRLTAALWRFWQHFTHNQEAMGWLEAALQLEVDPADRNLTAIRGKVVRGAGVISHIAGNFEHAINFHHEDLQLQQTLGDKAGQAQALLELGWSAFLQTNFEEAYSLAGQSLEMVRVQSVGDKASQAHPLQLRAAAAYSLSKIEESLNLNLQCLAIWRDLQDTGSIATVLNGLGLIYLAQNNMQEARMVLSESLELQPTLNDKVSLLFCVDTITRLALQAKQFQAAARLRGFSMMVASSLGGERPPISKMIFGDLGELSHYRMSAQAFEELLRAGQKLSFYEAIALARTICQPPSAAATESSPALPAARSRNYPANLSEREVEVLRLIAAGLSNPDIAEKLILSRRTVEAHLRTIYSKIEVTTRSAAARYAIEHHLE